MLFDPDRESLHWNTAQPEKGEGNYGADQSEDGPRYLEAGNRRKGKGTQRVGRGRGQLFQPRPGQQSLPRSGCPCPLSAATVVVLQTPTTGSWHERLPRRVSLRDARVGTIGKDNEQLPVGESMNGPWSESRDAGNPHVRFDERDLETGILPDSSRLRTMSNPELCSSVIEFVRPGRLFPLS